MRLHLLTRGCTALLILCLPVAAPAAQPDGPYVLRDAGAGWEAVSVAPEGEQLAKQSKPVRVGDALAIPAVGTVPGFSVTLREPAPDAASEVTTAKKAPVFVVADTHGEYEILISMLRAQKVLGPKLEWKFGRGHLVVLGDVFDRGPNHLEILWLLYKLQAEAQKAGGGAHFVLGNHESMALRGDPRYLNPKYQDTAGVLAPNAYASLFANETLLGQWIRSRPAVLRVNDSLCLHGGISRALLDSTLTLKDINDAVREALRGNTNGATSELVMGILGPLWYRGYFPQYHDFPTATGADVDLALKTFGARRILIGHTIVPTVTPMFDGKVVAVQVYPKREAEQTIFESLLIRDGKLFQARLDGSLQPLHK